MYLGRDITPPNILLMVQTKLLQKELWLFCNRASNNAGPKNISKKHKGGSSGCISYVYKINNFDNYPISFSDGNTQDILSTQNFTVDSVQCYTTQVDCHGTQTLKAGGGLHPYVSDTTAKTDMPHGTKSPPITMPHLSRNMQTLNLSMCNSLPIIRLKHSCDVISIHLVIIWHYQNPIIIIKQHLAL